jgi:hypothetical protein
MTSHPCAAGCGRRVSGNKLRCLRCIEKMAQATVEAKEEEPLENTTHIIMYFDSKDQEDLYRADGMIVASRQGDIVRFGHDIATAESRLFLNKELAKAWLRKLAEVDRIAAQEGLKLHELVNNYASIEAPVSIEERNAESLLTLPGRLKGIN